MTNPITPTPAQLKELAETGRYVERVKCDPQPERTGFIEPPKDFSFLIPAIPIQPLPIFTSAIKKRLSK